MNGKLRTVLLENPPTFGQALVAVVIALLTWAGTSAPDWIPGYVVWSTLVLAGVVAIGAIGRATQRWTLPTEWLDAETIRQLTGRRR